MYSFLVIFLTLLGAGPAWAQAVTVLNAGSFRHAVASHSIAVAFPPAGHQFTTLTAEATALPLPNTLARVRVFVDIDQAHLRALSETDLGLLAAPLFFVAPNQINFLTPLGLQRGLHSLIVVTPDGRNLVGVFFVEDHAPGVFTLLGNGQGEAAANYLRVGDQGVIVLYATGINNSFATLRLADREYQPQYVGPAPGFAGLIQLNYVIPISDLTTQQMGATVRIYAPAGLIESQGFLVRFQ